MAAQLSGWLMKIEGCLRGDGILTEEVEVEPDTLINNPRHLTDNQIDFGDPAGISCVGLLQDYRQDTLRNTELVHPPP